MSNVDENGSGIGGCGVVVGISASGMNVILVQNFSFSNSFSCGFFQYYGSVKGFPLKPIS